MPPGSANHSPRPERPTLLLLTWQALVACDPRVIVGEQDPTPPTNELPWAADHEIGTLDEWLADGFGWQNTERASIEVTTERARRGDRALAVVIDPPDAELSQAFVSRDVPADEATCSAWFFLPEAPDTNHLVLMKLSVAKMVDRFDIDIFAPGGVEPRLRIYEHGEEWITDPASVIFPVGGWVHLQAYIRTESHGVPRLVVLQDGDVLFDLEGHETVPEAPFSWMVGAAAHWVTPSPFRLFIDDASVTTAQPAGLP